MKAPQWRMLLIIGLFALLTACAAPPPEAATTSPQHDREALVAAEAFDFSSLAQMVATSDLVVRGRVTETRPGRIVGAEPTPHKLESEYSGPGSGMRLEEVVVDVEAILHGEPPGRPVVVEVDGWWMSNEERVVLEEQVGFDNGQEVVLALHQKREQLDEPRFALVSSQGAYLLDGPRVIPTKRTDDLVRAIEQWGTQRLLSEVEAASLAAARGMVTPLPRPSMRAASPEAEG